MINLDLIELADLVRPDDIAAAIIAQNPNLPIPVPVSEIARLAGISEVKAFASEGFEGMLVTNSEKSEGVICYSCLSPVTRQRFTIGHELGHFLLPWHRKSNFQCTSEDMRTNEGFGINAEWEAQANQFSAELLLPRSPFRQRLRQVGDPDLEQVIALSEEFQTSFEATMRRYIELSDYPCAVIFSKDNVVRYSRTSELFPFSLDVKKGSQLPRGSTSRNSVGDIKEWEEIDSYWWLKESKRQQPLTLLEQTYRQQNHYKVTLLYADEIGDD